MVEPVKPNLFIVGAPRCGTTAWVEYLSAHPSIYFSAQKEPHYFCEDFPRFRWARTLDDYHELFKPAGAADVIGEASVQYLYSEVAAIKIASYNPAARILIFLRDQSSFLPSYHNQLLYNKDEDIEDFATAWQLAVDRIIRQPPKGCREERFLDYSDVGRFDQQISRYLNVFPPDQIMVLWYRDWSKDPRRAYLAILDFLGLPDDGREAFDPVHGAKYHVSQTIADFTQRPPGWVRGAAGIVKRATGVKRLRLAERLRKVNQRKGYRSELSDELRAEIAQFYAPHNKRLAELTGIVRLFT